MKRLISGLVLGAILVLSIWVSNPYYFVAFGVLVMGIALWEFFGLAARVGCRCFDFLGYLAAALVVYAFITQQLGLVLPISAGLMLAMMIGILFEKRQADDFKDMLGSVAGTLFGLFYVVVQASFLISIRMIESPQIDRLSSRLLTLFFLIIVFSDSGAYYVGKNFGKHKLAPKMSPGKTIEGSLGGMVSAIIVAIVAKYTFFPALPLWHAPILAVVLNIVGQMGDLFESLLKRGAGAKDAASIIPGHGGLLDRLDSIVFNAPLVYYYYLLAFKN